MQAAPFRPEVADVVRRVIPVGPRGRRVEDVPGCVVVEDRPDGTPGVPVAPVVKPNDPDGIAAGKAHARVGRAGGIVLVLYQGDRFRRWERTE